MHAGALAAAARSLDSRFCSVSSVGLSFTTTLFKTDDMAPKIDPNEIKVRCGSLRRESDGRPVEEEDLWDARMDGRVG